MITPRTLKGFRDYPPALMIPRERLLEKAREVYRKYGFAPIDTPALEYAEILLGKGGDESDKITYRFTDHGGRDVAMRFDLTVPFARFAAQYIGELGTPFKRYAMGPVWRGENTGHGRYREFWQCDFDIIGTMSNAADIEIVLVINDMMEALGFDRFQVRINNRQVLNGVLAKLGVADRAVPILRALDKFDKIGRDGVLAELTASEPALPPEEEGNPAAARPPQRASLSLDAAEAVLGLATGYKGATNEEVLAGLTKNVGEDGPGVEGTKRLGQLLAAVRDAGVPDGRVQLDPSICRGLDYYTGTIYETTLLDLPGIGSVCSGGRYDNLAGLYTKQQLPGVGASLGLDRLLTAMEELKLLPKVSTPAPVFVVLFDANRVGEYQGLARRLRAEGIGVEVYPDAKKLGQQLGYADKKGHQVAVIAGSNEFSQGVWQLKVLANKHEGVVPTAKVVDAIRGILNGEPFGSLKGGTGEGK
jgi:histidyl-tRNA synthetase